MKQFPDPSNLGEERQAVETKMGKRDVETEIKEEDKELFGKLKTGATNVVKCFSLKRSPENNKGESLLIVTDSGADPLMIRAFREAGKEIANNDFQMFVAPKTEHAAQGLGSAIGEKMMTADAVLLVTSLSRSHAKESVEMLYPQPDPEVISALLKSPKLEDAFAALRGKYSPEQITQLLKDRKLDPTSMTPSKSRFISITNTNLDTLTQGAALEDPTAISERLGKFAEVIKDVRRVKITSENGTSLELNMKMGSELPETGIVDRPGQVSNFPSGEYAGSVDTKGTNGVYIVDGAVGMIGAVKEPIKITIEDGVAVKIEGGEDADKLRSILEKAQADYKAKNPDDKRNNAFMLAEFAFGMNSKAFRYDKDGKRVSPPTSLEGEKGLGTIHIALGKNALFNMSKDDPDYNTIPIHIDCVAMNTNITGLKEDGSEIELLKDGQVVCL